MGARHQLESNLADARQAIESLEERVHRTQAIAGQLTNERDRAIVTIEEVSRKLNEVESSLAWRAVDTARATKDLLIPHGTRRRRIYNLGLDWLKNGALRRNRR
jgi:hypothetical protein